MSIGTTDIELCKFNNEKKRRAKLLNSGNSVKYLVYNSSFIIKSQNDVKVNFQMYGANTKTIYSNPYIQGTTVPCDNLCQLYGLAKRHGKCITPCYYCGHVTLLCVNSFGSRPSLFTVYMCVLIVCTDER